jgi:rfaE bifunctional protein kinase chain/domain
LDFENKPDHEVLSLLLKDFEKVITGFDIVVFSDYDKGGLSHIQEMINVAKLNNKPVLVDPKGTDYAKYMGATIITPNKSEMADVVGSWKTEAELSVKALQLIKQLSLEALLLTRSEEGMTLFSRSDEPQSIPAAAREVFDVTGAGDTVIATLAALIASGYPILEAVRWANKAAGIVVGKLSTATTSYNELFHGQDSLLDDAVVRI